MSAASSDRNLLLGILALQMDFITRDALVAAMNQWTLEKWRALSEILVARGDLDSVDRLILDQIVDRHIVRHGGDPRQSLFAIDVATAARSVLEPINDCDIRESLSSLTGGIVTGDLTETTTETTGTWHDATRAGRFKILRLIDEGGLGSVYLAQDSELNREVALKQIKEEFAGHPQSRARFVLEAEITGSLEHPGVVPVYGNGKYDDGRPYYAMQFVRGENLKVAADRFHRDQRLLADPVAKRAELPKLLRRFLAVCETMAYAHSRGVIHRDLKPKNILLGPFGETLVVDWGLAKVVGHHDAEPPSDLTLRPPSSSDIEPTTAGTRVGTAAYMSPEQARGEVGRLGIATDIYGLGATLYYVLTGRAPFEDRDLGVLFGKLERGEFPPPRAVKPKVDRALDAICCRAMALEPSKRYRSARDFANDLDLWMTDQPVSAYREPIWVGVGRTLRRRWQLVASTVALLVLGVVGVSWHAWRIGGENAKTQAALQKASQLLGITRVALRDQSELAQTSLASFGKTEQLRLKLARNEVEVYKTLLTTYPEDPDIRFEAAERYRILAALLRLTGQRDATLECYDRSLDLFAGLLGGRKRGSEARRALVEMLIDRGELHRMNSRTALAVKDYDAALQHVEYFANDADSLAYKRLKASISINLSGVMIVWDRQEDALRNADLAIDLLNQVSRGKLSPDETNHLAYLLGIAYTNRAIASQEMNDHRVAEESCDRAIASARSVPSDSYMLSGAQWVIAVALSYRGEVLGRDPARAEEALKCFDESLALIRMVLEKHAEMPHFRAVLADVLSRKSGFLLDHGRVAEAENGCQTAREILEKLQSSALENPGYASSLGITLSLEAQIRMQKGDAESGRQLFRRAAGQFEKALNIDPDRHRDRRKLDAARTKSKP